MKKINPSESGFNEILLYTTPNGNVRVEIHLQNETIWLTQQKIADLFGVDRTVVTKHIGNIFKTGELNEQLVCANFAHTTPHGAIKGKTQETITRFYNLDVIISVGYRVNSSQATAFRIWATERLKEYIIKGFTMVNLKGTGLPKISSSKAILIKLLRNSIERKSSPNLHLVISP
ncbi:MAG: RhuM family protein [Mariniphaga sp.]